MLSLPGEQKIKEYGKENIELLFDPKRP